MRPSLPSPACAVLLLLCLFTFGCSGGTPFNADGRTTPVTTPVTTPTTPVTTPVTTPTTPVTTPPTQGASVSVMISDPAACKAPNGLFAHVYITVADVKGSTNPDAPAGDPSFVDLTPGLSSAPQQIDLLGKADSNCFLASLSVSQLVEAGNYQQIRIFLAPDSAASSVQNNACGALYSNCVVNTDNSLHDLQLAAATAKGIVVPVAQIANGGVALNTAEQPAVDVNFDTCSSILLTPDGGYEFNPVIHIGLVHSAGGSISGMVVNSKTGQPLQGGHVVVALEQKEAKTGIDRILMSTAASNDGSFVLCPVPQGTYDLVAVGVDGADVSYSAGVETGIQAGQLAGKIPLVPGSGEGTLQGLITTQNGGRPVAGVSTAVQASALQQLAADNGTTITVPLLPSYDPYNAAMLTEKASSCPHGVDCASFALQLPATAPNVVACSEQTAQFTQQQNVAPSYSAEAYAQIPGSGGVADCVLNSLSVTATSQGRSIVLNPDQSTTAATLAFTQCE
jgi:hypothetical protein